MPSYYARVCFSYAFAQDMLEKNILPYNRFRKELPEGCNPQSQFERYTFGVLSLDAASQTKCGEIISAAWASAFPENIDDMSYMITPNDGSDTAELMRAIYQVYYGAEPYQELVTELTAVIPMLKERSALTVLRMQNYLFAIDSGCGFTSLLSSFGDYLNKLRVYGDDDDKHTMYSEYIISYNSDDGIKADDLIEELKQDPDEINDAIIGIDISYYLEGRKYDELRKFVRRLYKLQDYYIFMFRIPFLENNAMDEAADVLKDVMLLKVIQIPPLHDVVLYEYMWDTLRRLGYKSAASLADPFFELIRREKQDGRFYGFKTAEKVVHEMIMRKSRHDAAKEALGENTDREYMYPEDLDLIEESSKTKSGYDELGDLIGMEAISDKVREIAAQVKLSMNDEKLDRPCIHMRFVGSPGTGKTTVARIIGRIFREEGILRKGAFLEYSARSLCAEFVGQTAVKTASICRDAYGSVLFIDEAYALYDGTPHTNDYGKEALTTLISEMENHRDDMLVIMAGYTDDMDTLMKGNAGLRSRMPYIIEFPNYTREQMFEIFMHMVIKHFEYEPELEKEAKRYFDSLSKDYISSREFANARFVRNLYERTWSKAAMRASMAGLNRIKLTKNDLLAAESEKEFSEKLETTKRIGF